MVKGKRTDLSSNPCPIARALDIIGDWWSILIIRDAHGGTCRFSEFQRNLNMAKNILASRLRKLVDADILELAPAEDGSAYKEYRLTEKGEQLRLVLVALREWGERYAPCPPATPGSGPGQG
jgi:DNA-binding HxlR family transcriptional regulator